MWCCNKIIVKALLLAFWHRVIPRCFWVIVLCLCGSQSSMLVPSLKDTDVHANLPIYFPFVLSTTCFHCKGWATWDVLDLSTGEELAQLSLRINVVAPCWAQQRTQKVGMKRGTKRDTKWDQEAKRVNKKGTTWKQSGTTTGTKWE